MITYGKYFDTALKYFPLIIAYTFFNELLGYFIRYQDGFAFFSKEELNSANGLIYNIYEFIFYGSFFYIYWKLARNSIQKKGILALSIISLLSYIINSFFHNPIHIILYWASAIASISLFIIALEYLIGLKNIQEGRLQKYNLMFWVSLSIAIFYFIFPILSIIGYENYELWEKLKLRTVLKILIVVMYTLFGIGFIMSRRRAFR